MMHRIACLGLVGWLAGCATRVVTVDEPDAVMTAPAAGRAPVPSDSRPLTVEEAVQKAILCSPRIETLRAAVRVAEQQGRAVMDIRDPELGFAWGQDVNEIDRHRSSSRNTVQKSRESQMTTSSQTKTGQSSSSGGSSSILSSSQSRTDFSESAGRESETETGVSEGRARSTGDGWRISARFFVPNPWILGPQADARKADVCAAKADLQDAIWFVTCEVRRWFAEMAFLNDDMELAAKQVRLSAEILEAVREQEARRAAVSSDVTSAAQRYLRNQDEFDQVRYRYKLAQRSLAALLNLPPGSVRIATNAVPVQQGSGPVISLEKAEETARRCRGDVVALGWRTLAAKAAYREMRNTRRPWIKEITASYRSSRDNTWGSNTSTAQGMEAGTATRSTIGLGQEQRTDISSGGKVDTTGETLVEQSQASSRRSVQTSEYGTERIADEGESEEWWIGFAVDVPVFSWLKNHADDVRLAEYKLACATEDEGIRICRQAIRDAIDEVEESRLRQERYHRDMGPIIESMRRTLETLNSMPNTMPDKAAAIEFQIVESMRLDLDARRRHALSLINLEYAMGAQQTEAKSGGLQHE